VSGAIVLDLAREALWVMILIGAPSMLVGLAVGLVIGLVQALTQIQEATLVFVPKILAIFVTMILTLPFMGATLGSFMNRVADMIMTGG
jgi:flagellar biosynthetic protein FliQ